MTTKDGWSVEYKRLVREFIATHGDKVRFEDRGWGQAVSTYGWSDWDARKHTHPHHQDEPACSWIVPEGTILTEETYSQFAGTFTENDQEVGVNVEGCSCKCGKYTDVTLRWTGTVTEMLHSILGLPDARMEIKL